MTVIKKIIDKKWKKIILFFICGFIGYICGAKTYYLFPINDKYNNPQILCNDSNIQEVKVGVIDSFYNDENIKIYNNINDSYSGVDQSSNVYFKKNVTHGEETLKTLENTNTNIETDNTKKIYLTSVEDEKGVIKEEYILNAINHLIEKKVNIIVIPIGVQANSKELEEAIKKATDKGIYVIAPQGDNVSDTLYPAQYNNVISISGQHIDYLNEETKINFYAPDSYATTTSQATAAAGNVAAACYKEPYENKEDLEKINNMSFEKLADYMQEK